MVEDNNKKDKLKAAAVTVVVHAVLVAFLAFLTLQVSEPEKDELEDGIPVMLGNVPDAGDAQEGNNMTPPEAENSSVEEQIPEEEHAPEPVPEKGTKEPLITQDKEPSVNLEEKKRQEEEKKRQEEERRRKEEAERKRQEEARKRAEEERRKIEVAAAAANKKVTGAFGKTGGTGRGETSGEGVQGVSTGNSNSGAKSGVGGTGVNAVVGSRTPKFLQVPEYKDPTSEGTVVVAIVVNSRGVVTSATIKSSTTTSSLLRNAAIAAARRSTFSASDNNNESGTITYRFKLR